MIKIAYISVSQLSGMLTSPAYRCVACEVIFMLVEGIDLEPAKPMLFCPFCGQKVEELNDRFSTD